MTLLARTILEERPHARIHGRGQGGVVTMKNSTATKPTTVGSETTVVKEIRAEVSKVLRLFPTKRIETAGDLSDEGARLLKLGRRTISTETMIRLARAGGELGPAMWSAICELCARPAERLESPRMVDAYAALQMLAQTPGPHGEFAAAVLRVMNNGGPAQIEVLPKRPPAPSIPPLPLFEQRRA